ncbi:MULTISPECIES: hypothetical protein [unclassified Mesorhizobium]|uniref:hypothetical protein n=2 Tax=Mesorhizobium TaxID=68287 RepID=UPI0012249ED5|nr:MULTISPECIES: hypothetical protein [unclassified Mesorhizobium]TIN12992.1 MAG: hypothetical protein E5Y51_27450 [Mesorhizobium sp.]
MDAVAVELLPPMVAFPLPPLAPPIETLALLLLPPKDALPSAPFGPPALASALLPPTDTPPRLPTPTLWALAGMARATTIAPLANVLANLFTILAMTLSLWFCISALHRLLRFSRARSF